MATGIIILGSPGAGKTSLGRTVAASLGFTFLDIDDFLWRKDTPVPFTVMYSRPERISRLMAAVESCEHFVMAGSMSSFHEHFDPFFELAVHLNAATSLRVQRAHERELALFGDRVLEGGDMYAEHCSFLEGVAGYDYGKGGSTLQQHEEWLASLTCPIIRLDGAQPLSENTKRITDTYKNIKAETY